MILHKIALKDLTEYKDTWNDIDSDLEEYEIDRLKALNLDEAWYWYGTGSYSGAGYILMRKDDLYCIQDMGHCSCYGPIDSIVFAGVKLSEIQEKRTKNPEYWKEIQDLVNAASQKRFNI